MPTIVSHDDEKMAAYVHFLMYTRLAPEGHGGYLRNDNKAKTHCIYGQHNAPLAPMTNNPVESIIRSQMVDAVGRRSFTSVYLLVVYLSGHSIDRRPVTCFGGTVVALSSGVLGREACHELARNTIGELVTTKANCDGRTMVEHDNP